MYVGSFGKTGMVQNVYIFFNLKISFKYTGLIFVKHLYTSVTKIGNVEICNPGTVHCLNKFP